MTQRERGMLLVVGVLGGFLLLFGGFVMAKGWMDTIDEKDDLVLRLEREQQTHQTKLMMLARDQRKLEQWKAISMPPDAGTAAARYRSFLTDLARKHLTFKQLTEGGGAGMTRNQLTSHQTFTLRADGSLAQVIAFLRDFYSVNLPHQVKSIDLVTRGAGAESRLEMTLTVETLTLPNIPNRDFLPATPDPRVVALETFTALKGGPGGLALGPWTASPFGLHGNPKLASTPRDYSRLPNKNIFAGIPAAPTGPVAGSKPPPDPGVLKFVRLTSITGTLSGRKAELYNPITNRSTQIRAEGGFDSFEIRDANDHVILSGKIKHVDARDVILFVDGKHYSLHWGETLAQALEKPLSDQELKEKLNGKQAAAPPEAR